MASTTLLFGNTFSGITGGFFSSSNFSKTCCKTIVRTDGATRDDGSPWSRSTRRGDGVRRSS